MIFSIKFPKWIVFRLWLAFPVMAESLPLQETSGVSCYLFSPPLLPFFASSKLFPLRFFLFEQVSVIPAELQMGWGSGSVSTMVGFGLSIFFIAFVFTRLLCRRLRAAAPRPTIEPDFDPRIDIEQVK